jgi:hypothetical protein
VLRLEALRERAAVRSQAELPDAGFGELAHQQADLVLAAAPGVAAVEVEDGWGLFSVYHF